MPSAAPGDAEAGCALQNRVFAAAEGGGGSLRAVGSTHQGRAPQSAGGTRRAPPLGGTARPRAVLVRAEVTYPSSSHQTVRCWGGVTGNCRGAGRCRRGHGNFPEQRVAVVSEDTQERASSNAILEATRNQPTHQLTYPVAS